MRFPLYPEHRETGVDWLGEVPVHWKVVAIKWLSPVLRGASPRPIDDPIYFDEEGEFGWVRISDVSSSNDGCLYETTQKLSNLGASFSVKLQPDSLFLSIAGSVGKPCIPKIKACIHDGFVYFPMLSIDERFLYRIFELGYCFGGLGKLGTQLNLNTETVGGIRIALPPNSELNKVLAFLDHEVARIDALVEEQQRLIELLKEKRQAVISHAVTKGLDPDVPMKDSGVEWLGEVPAHWRITRVGWIISELTYGFTNPMPTENEGPKMLTANDIGWGEIFYETARSTSEGAFKKLLTEKSRPRAGDLLLTKDGTLGRVAIHDGQPACINQSVALIRPFRVVKPEFLCSLLQASCYQNQMLFEAGGTTIKHIYISRLAKMPIALPPLAEQELIFRKMGCEGSRYSSLIDEAERSARLLTERRSALISAAVTGKIDVRGWQPTVNSSTFAESTEKEAV